MDDFLVFYQEQKPDVEAAKAFLKLREEIQAAEDYTEDCPEGEQISKAWRALSLRQQQIAYALNNWRSSANAKL